MGGFLTQVLLDWYTKTVHTLILTPSKLGFTLVAHSQEPCLTAFTSFYIVTGYVKLTSRLRGVRLELLGFSVDFLKSEQGGS